MKQPHVLPRTPHAHPAWARRHPHEHQFVGRSLALSVGIHLLFAAMVAMLALYLDRVTFSQAHSIAQSGPAPLQAMTMSLVTAEPRPPSPPLPTKPTTEPGLPVLPVIQPFPKPSVVITLVPPPPKPLPVPAPQPTPILTKAQSVPVPSPVKITAKPRPKYAVTNVAGEGKAPEVTSEQLAKMGFPAPNYPPAAQAMRQTGTVLIEVDFGPDGRVTSAQVRQSSGSFILDKSTQNFIRVHWKDFARANTILYAPIVYTLPGTTTVVR